MKNFNFKYQNFKDDDIIIFLLVILYQLLL